MHNLHLARIRADDGQSACERVECIIEEWGTENNWRVACGAVSEDGEVWDTGCGRFRPSTEELTTIEDINKLLSVIVNKPPYDSEECFKKIKRMSTEKLTANTEDRLSEGDNNEWSILYGAMSYIDWLLCTRHLRGNPVNVLEDEVFEWRLDTMGLTDLERSSKNQDATKWIVFIDMHS